MAITIDAEQLVKNLNQMALDIFSIALAYGMPDDYWEVDERINRACRVLSWSPTQARLWAEGQRERF